MNDTQVWTSALEDAVRCLQQFLGDRKNLELCERFTQMLAETYERHGNLFTCGNGGSHCDAMHFAEELTGRYRKNRRPLGALALGDPSHTTCVSNDYGFDHVFARQIEGLGRPGDMIVGMSTSGNSKNLILAFESARRQGLKTVALLGKGGGALKDIADLAIIVPGETSDRIQEIHIKLIHIVIETLERKLFPDNY